MKENIKVNIILYVAYIGTLGTEARIIIKYRVTCSLDKRPNSTDLTAHKITPQKRHSQRGKLQILNLVL